MYVTKELITPDLARKYLDRNIPGNRHLVPTRVKIISGAIKRGEWQVTHQGVAFNTKGELIDGQHRLAAVIDSDVAVDMMVARGVPDASFLAIDQGKNRNACDLFQISRPAAAAVRSIWRAAFRGISPTPTTKQLEPLVKVFAPIADDMCGPNTSVGTHGVGRRAFFAGAVLQAANGNAEYAKRVYNAITNLRFEECTPLQQSTARKIMTENRMPSEELTVRAFIIFDPNCKFSVLKSNSLPAAREEIRDLVERLTGGAERQMSHAAD